MKNTKAKKLTREEKLDHYLNAWGNDKKSLISVTRQLIFIFGIITCIIVATWVMMNAVVSYVDTSTYKNITNNVAIVSVVFIAFNWALSMIYIISEWALLNKRILNRLPSLIIASITALIWVVFLVLTCYEIWGSNKASRDHIYIVYMVICFACGFFSTIFSFTTAKKKQNFNPNFKLIKSLAYTVGFLGILIVGCYILWLMWYVAKSGKWLNASFLIARTAITLLGTMIVLGIFLLVLWAVVMVDSPNRKKRIIYFSILIALLIGFECALSWLFLKGGKWETAELTCKLVFTFCILTVIATSAIDIALASRYASHLEREEK